VRVKWLRIARANLDRGAQYIARDNPSAAAGVVFSITEGEERLREYPGLGRPGRVLGTRELVVPDTSYIIPYRVRGNTLEVLRVFHTVRGLRGFEFCLRLTLEVFFSRPGYPLLSSAFPQTGSLEKLHQKRDLKGPSNSNTFSFKRMHRLDLRL
jgi:toxin ParE1/3/4